MKENAALTAYTIRRKFQFHFATKRRTAKILLRLFLNQNIALPTQEQAETLFWVCCFSG